MRCVVTGDAAELAAAAAQIAAEEDDDERRLSLPNWHRGVRCAPHGRARRAAEVRGPSLSSCSLSDAARKSCGMRRLGQCRSSTRLLERARLHAGRTRTARRAVRPVNCRCCSSATRGRRARTRRRTQASSTCSRRRAAGRPWRAGGAAAAVGPSGGGQTSKSLLHGLREDIARAREVESESAEQRHAEDLRGAAAGPRRQAGASAEEEVTPS